jgi:hypothetical protein
MGRLGIFSAIEWMEIAQLFNRTIRTLFSIIRKFELKLLHSKEALDYFNKPIQIELLSDENILVNFKSLREQLKLKGNFHFINIRSFLRCLLAPFV